MKIETGKVYYRKLGADASVRLIKRFSADDYVHYQVLYGPELRDGIRFGKCKRKTFKNWVYDLVPPNITNYEELTGAIIHKNYMVLGTKGNELFKCTEKRAKFYLRKNYVFPVNDNTQKG